MAPNLALPATPMLPPARASRAETPFLAKVRETENLRFAWQQVRGRLISQSIGGPILAEFRKDLGDHLGRLAAELESGAYRPEPVPSAMIGERNVSACVGMRDLYDRVCQQAIVNCLQPLLDGELDDANFSYRRGRSRKDAFQKIWRELDAGLCWVLHGELRSFPFTFDSNRLLPLVKGKLSDEQALALIDRIVRCDGAVHSRTPPLPGGNSVHSGMLATYLNNVLLTLFDQSVGRPPRGCHLIRFGGEWVVVCPTELEAHSALAVARRLLEPAGARVFENRTLVVHFSHGFDFLGCRIRRGAARPYVSGQAKPRPRQSPYVSAGIWERLRRWLGGSLGKLG